MTLPVPADVAPTLPAAPGLGRAVRPRLALRVLSRSLGICGRNLPALLAVAVAACLPAVGLLVAVAVAGGLGWAGVSDDGEVAGLLGLVLWVLQTVVQVGAVTSGTLGVLRGRPFGVRRSLAAGLRRFPAVVAVTAIGGAAVFAGTVVLLVPGLAALASLALSLPAAIEERAGPFRSIARSLDLTRGNRAAVLAVVLALAAVAYVASSVAAGLYESLGDLSALALLPCLGLLASLPAIGCATVYAELRDAKEGPPTSELVAVFE